MAPRSVARSCSAGFGSGCKGRQKGRNLALGTLELAHSQPPTCARSYAPGWQGRVPGKTGVWVGERKIAAVGVRISHGVTSHGIALNVCTDLAAFRHIVPCGTPDKEVTSIQQELGRAVGLEQAAGVFLSAFMSQFGYATREQLPDVNACVEQAGLQGPAPLH